MQAGQAGTDKTRTACGNHLVVGQSPNGGMNRFECRTCPYIYPIKETVRISLPFTAHILEYCTAL